MAHLITSFVGNYTALLSKAFYYGNFQMHKKRANSIMSFFLSVEGLGPNDNVCSCVASTPFPSPFKERFHLFLFRERGGREEGEKH